MHSVTLTDLRTYAADIEAGCFALSQLAHHMAKHTPISLHKSQLIVFAAACELASDKAALITDLATERD